MKPLFFIISCLFFGTLQAQWQTNFDDALALATAEDKPLVLVFSGSDWCGPCIRFKRNILDSEDFKSYAEGNYVMYNADFPKKKKNQLPEEKLNVNKSLAEAFNPKGHFPLVVVLDKEKSVLGKTGVDKRTSPKAFIAILNGFAE